MRNIINILLLLAAYILLCGKSCQDEGNVLLTQEEAVEAEREDISREFQVPYLSEESRYEREQAAIRKLADLQDFLAVFADTTLDTVFRSKAGEMIRDMFVSDTVGLSFVPHGGASGSTRLKEFLKASSLSGYYSSKTTFDSVFIARPLQRTATESYGGLLGCRQQVILLSPADTLSETRDITVEIFAIRKAKTFGPDTLHVWEVFFGDMRPLD